MGLYPRSPTSAQGQEADIAVPALDHHSWGVRQSLEAVEELGFGADFDVRL